MRKSMLYTVALLGAVLGIAVVAFGAPRRSTARIVVINESGLRLPVTMVIQEVDKNDASLEPAVISERFRRLNLGSTEGSARKMFGFSATPGVHRFIARPFERLHGGVLGEPLAEDQEFYVGDARAIVTFTIKAPPVIDPPPVGQYPKGFNIVDSLAVGDASFSRVFTIMVKDGAGVAIPTGDVRRFEVEWAMSPTVVPGKFGTIVPGYWSATATWVGDVAGTYDVRVTLSDGGVVSFGGQVYNGSNAVVMTITP